MPDEIHDLLAAEINAPTAMIASNLNYTHSTRGKIEVVILGNPTTPGAIVNCSTRMPEGKKARPPDAIALEFQEQPPLALKKGAPFMSIAVPPDFLYLEIKKEALTKAEIGRTEIVSPYDDGNGSFWRAAVASEEHAFCDVCQLKKESVDNPIILCDILGCLYGRHRLCMNSPPSREEVEGLSHTCEFHTRASPSTTRQLRPRRQLLPRTSSMPLDNLPSSTDEKQKYLPGEVRTREYNAEQSGCMLDVSGLPKAGLGLFTLLARKMGDSIAPVWGAIDLKTRLDELQAGTATNLSVIEKEHQEDLRNGIDRSIELDDILGAVSSESVLLVSRQCPAGYINHLPKSGLRTANCRFRLPNQATVYPNLHMPCDSIQVEALRDIEAGEELFCDYGNYNPSRKRRPAAPKPLEPLKDTAPDTAMFLFMANVSDEYMEKSNASGGGPERDRLRLDMIRQSDPASFSEEKMNFLT
ncbi:MAG: SET domain-containing protein-lysine N-methyltransferase, partial [Candidatus Pacebacteria bacterium]|nr:SET domain-containing protein-lysine N-methyltransferase [Candidatus Paceibacterota bacterium]